MTPATSHPQPSPRPSAAGVWWLAARPKTLSAASVPVLVGSACAYAAGGMRWLPALAALVGALLLQIGANFANDVYDFEKGADTTDRLGPMRAVQAGWVTPAAMRRALFVVFALALLIGVYLTAIAGPAIVAIGIASIVAALAYTGGPYPLGYNGLGDALVLVFFGPVAVCGTAFVQLGYVPMLAALASVPIGALATAILVVNNVRDRATDARAGKRTLAVRLGFKAVLAEYAAAVLLPNLLPLYLALVHGGRFVLLPLLAVPMALALLRAVARESGGALNARLAGTAKLLFVWGVLLSAGIVLDHAVLTSAAAPFTQRSS